MRIYLHYLCLVLLLLCQSSCGESLLPQKSLPQEKFFLASEEKYDQISSRSLDVDILTEVQTKYYKITLSQIYSGDNIEAIELSGNGEFTVSATSDLYDYSFKCGEWDLKSNDYKDFELVFYAQSQLTLKITEHDPRRETMKTLQIPTGNFSVFGDGVYSIRFNLGTTFTLSANLEFSIGASLFYGLIQPSFTIKEVDLSFSKDEHAYLYLLARVEEVPAKGSFDKGLCTYTSPYYLITYYAETEVIYTQDLSETDDKTFDFMLYSDYSPSVYSGIGDVVCEDVELSRYDTYFSAYQPFDDYLYVKFNKETIRLYQSEFAKFGVGYYQFSFSLNETLTSLNTSYKIYYLGSASEEHRIQRIFGPTVYILIWYGYWYVIDEDDSLTSKDFQSYYDIRIVTDAHYSELSIYEDICELEKSQSTSSSGSSDGVMLAVGMMAFLSTLLF